MHTAGPARCATSDDVTLPILDIVTVAAEATSCIHFRNCLIPSSIPLSSLPFPTVAYRLWSASWIAPSLLHCLDRLVTGGKMVKDCLCCDLMTGCRIAALYTIVSPETTVAKSISLGEQSIFSSSLLARNRKVYRKTNYFANQKHDSVHHSDFLGDWTTRSYFYYFLWILESWRTCK